MLTFTTLLIALILLASAIAAGWPLIALPRIRAAALSAGGTCCVGSGAALLGLLAAGLIGLPAMAQEQASAPEVLSAEQPATASSQTAALPAAPPAPVPPAPPEPTDPASPPPEADDLKIETQPDGTIVIPAGRPKWIESAPKMLKNVYTISVTSGPYARASEAHRQLDHELVLATNEFIADQLGSQLAPKFLNYDARTLKERFITQPIYEETITVSIGPMHQSHALLEFGPEFRGEIEAQWAKVRATSRLAQMGLFAGGALLLLGSVFGYFRLDNATRGYYTGRLQFLAAAAILAVVGAGAVLSQWITWM